MSNPCRFVPPRLTMNFMISWWQLYCRKKTPLLAHLGQIRNRTYKDESNQVRAQSTKGIRTLIHLKNLINCTLDAGGVVEKRIFFSTFSILTN